MASGVVGIHSVEQLNNLTSEHKYVILDFWADWCPPCKAIAPFFANLAQRHSKAKHLAFGKVDVEELPDISQAYGITAMPTFLIFENGEPVGVSIDNINEVCSGGAVVSDGRIAMIRGADPKSLTVVVDALSALAAVSPTSTSILPTYLPTYLPT